MQYFFSLFTDYFKTLDKLSFLLITVFVAILTFFNYRYGWSGKMWQASTEFEKFLRFYSLYFLVFAGSYFILHLFGRTPIRFPLPLLVLIAAAPAVFALKVVFSAHRPLFFKIFQWPHSRYYYMLFDYPVRLVLVLLLCWLLWIWIKPAYPFCGLTLKNFALKPYLILLACMIPLIVFASTRPDFLHTYPKFKNISFFTDTSTTPWLNRLWYELSYGIDFITIEVFFRGFLVLAFAHFAGKDAILPMAAFYCVIHFGKPLPECISSFFGGMLLGILVYRTETIIGGLIVHLGIAWLMEAGGYLGNLEKGKVLK
ncbi:MAG TPA: CPBP family intramembrane glutamic endopeptidase [Chitinophagaceae bacterium]